MDKRYQVFVSSTFEDLVEERLEVMKALLELDCIPSGMEYFPAANEDQWTFIKNLIDTCDYYILIVGGKYGSEDNEGKGFTQKEYEYALSKGIPTIGFIHHNRDSLPSGKKENAPNKIIKLAEFISIVQSKLCKEWNNAYELGAVVSRSLTQLIKSNPRMGWVRADKVRSEEILTEVNNLRKENQILKERIHTLEEETPVLIDTKNIAFEEFFKIEGTYSLNALYGSLDWEQMISWKDIFTIISPFLIRWCHEDTIKKQIAISVLKRKQKITAWDAKIDIEVFHSIKIQFLALNLISESRLETQGGGFGIFWQLTKIGKEMMLKEGSVKKK